MGGIMFGYASDETADCMPLTHSMATRLGKGLTDVHKSGELWWLRPDGKTQVTIEYKQKADGSVEPQKIHTVVISTQHAEPSKATRTKEVAGYSGPDETAPSMKEMNDLIVEKVVKRTLAEIKLKNGEAALSLYGDHTHLHINPSGKFIIGGPQGDAGLTGRKIIIDTYGGWGAHGGGAFSGKDPTKVDRSAAYICRQMAKSVVKSGLCKRALVQLSYAIGVAKPLSLFVETYGTEQGELSAADITNVIKSAFDCRPGAIAQSLALREPKHLRQATTSQSGWIDCSLQLTAKVWFLSLVAFFGIHFSCQLLSSEHCAFGTVCLDQAGASSMTCAERFSLPSYAEERHHCMHNYVQ